jgi:hypothetical protein
LLWSFQNNPNLPARRLLLEASIPKDTGLYYVYAQLLKVSVKIHSL